MNFSALKNLGLSKRLHRDSGPIRNPMYAEARPKKPELRASKTLLSVLVDQSHLLCVLQNFDGGGGQITAVREFGIDLYDSEVPRPVTLSALLSDFIGPKHSVDAAFIYLGESLTERHKVVADGMSREDVLAAIRNQSFWPNMVVTARELEEQEVCFELFELDGSEGSGTVAQAVFLNHDLLADIEKSLASLKLQCFSISPIGSAISGCLLHGSELDVVGVDIHSDGRAVIYPSGAGRYTPVDVYLPVSGSKIQPFNPALSSAPTTNADGGPHPIWGMNNFETVDARYVIFSAPEGIDVEVLRGPNVHSLERFDAQIDTTVVEDQFNRISSTRLVTEAIYMAQYTQIFTAAAPGGPPRDSDLNFRDKSWDLFDGDRRKSALRRSLFVSSALGVMSAIAITATARMILPDYNQIALDNEQVKSELVALDSDVMTVRQEFEMLALREEAIAQISGNHRDVYAALISVLARVPSQVQLSRVSLTGEAGNVSIEGIGINEIAVSNFVGLLSGGGRARASLLQISVNEEGGFAFEVSVPYADLL